MSVRRLLRTLTLVGPLVGPILSVVVLFAGTSAAAGRSGPNDTVAVVGDQTITLYQVHQKALERGRDLPRIQQLTEDGWTKRRPPCTLQVEALLKS